MIEIYIETKARPKQSFQYGNGRGWHKDFVYDFKKLVAHNARLQIPKNHKIITGAVHVEIFFCFHHPQKANKELHAAMHELKYLYPKTTRPDEDNLTKAIFDALNKIVWKDDAQVCETTKHKCWGDKNEIMIRITELPSDWRFQKNW